MENNKYNIDDIENFLNQAMDKEALNDFEKEVNSNKDFSEEVGFHKDIIKGITEAGAMDFRKMVGNVHQDMKAEGFFLEKETIATSPKKQTASIRRLPLMRNLAIAASFALALSAGWWMLSKPIAPEELFANNFSIHQDVLSVEISDRLEETGFGTNKAVLNGLQEGINYYLTGEYEKAIAQFSVFEIAAPEDALTSYATFYKAIALIATNQLSAAQQLLEPLSQQASNPLIEESKWNLALIYLKQNNSPAAKVLLMELRNTTTYSQKAAEILKKL